MRAPREDLERNPEARYMHGTRTARGRAARTRALSPERHAPHAGRRRRRSGRVVQHDLELLGSKGGCERR